MLGEAPGAGGYRGRESLLVFIAHLSGMTDLSGDLCAMDADKWRKPFLRKLIQENYMDTDKARAAAAEAGYIKANGTLVDYFDAVDRELRGASVFPPPIGTEYDAADASEAGADQHGEPP